MAKNQYTKQIQLVNPGANIDADYGPFDTVALANAAIDPTIRAGRTVAVGTTTLVEYIWHPGNVTDAGLVLKNTTSAANITDFTEAVQDAVAGLLGAGSNITVTYNDAANTFTIDAAGSAFDPEATRDAIGAALIGVGNISVTINDAGDTITISTTATVNSTDAALRDRNTHTGTDKYIPRNINPFLTPSGVVVKSSFTYTFTGNPGFYHGNKKYATILAGAYTLAAGQCLVASNIDNSLNYDGTAGQQPVITPTIKAYTGVSDTDVVLIWRGYNNDIQSIWDALIIPSTAYIQRVIQPALFTNGAVTRSGFSYILSGNLGFLHGIKKYAVVTPGTYTLAALECLVVSNVDRNVSYDAGAAPLQPIITPTIKAFNLVLDTDVVLVWRGYNNDIQSIWDGLISQQASVRITAPYIGKTPLSSIFQKIYNQDNLKILFTGDSIFESSNWWGFGNFPLGTAYTTKVGTDASQPFQMTDKLLSRKLYDLLMKHSLNTPVYRRFDYGSTFNYATGLDTTAGSKFFTESGTFGTWVSSDGNGVTSAEYSAQGSVAQIPMTLADATAAYTGSAWYMSGAQEGFTRKSYGASSYIQFTVPAGYSKIRIKLRKGLDGDVLTSTLTNCTGSASIDTNYGTVTHTNNSNFIDVEFTVTNTGLASTIRLTKSADTAKCLAYWGAYYYNEPCTIVNNYAHGGCTVDINYKILPDLLAAESYDFIIWEVQLLNDILSTTYAASKTAIQNYCNSLITYGKPVLAVIPQRGNHEGDLASDKMWGMAKSVLLANNIPFIDLGIIESSVVQQLGRVEGLKYLYGTGDVHPVTIGIDTLAIMFNSLINN